MPTPASPNPISLNDVQNEFSGSNPISLSEYYYADVGSPTGGAISLGDLRNKNRHAGKFECRDNIVGNGLYTGTSNLKRTQTAEITPQSIFYSSNYGWAIVKNNGQDLPYTNTAVAPIFGAGDFRTAYCTNNTIVWFKTADDVNSSEIGLGGFTVNTVPITLNQRFVTAGNIAVGNGVSDAACYVYWTGNDNTTASYLKNRVSSIGFRAGEVGTNANNLGDNSQCIAGAFVFPNKWEGTAITTSINGMVNTATTVSLAPTDMLFVAYLFGNDNPSPSAVPTDIRTLVCTADTSKNLTAFWEAINRWFNRSVVCWFSNTTNTTQTYTVPAATNGLNSFNAQDIGNHTLYRYVVKFTFVGDGYTGGQTT
jgi:hypothetical protein